jgi:hypothetical protein
VAPDEGFKALAMCELDIKPAAVAFDAAEGIQFAPVALVVERSEVSPVDLKAVPRTGFDAYVGAWRQQSPAQSRQIPLQDRSSAIVAKGPGPLCAMKKELTPGH